MTRLQQIDEGAKIDFVVNNLKPHEKVHKREDVIQNRLNTRRFKLLKQHVNAVMEDEFISALPIQF